ncbi:YihY/virulence factor BrkB family protein [Thalassiella azotivora]
MGIFSRSKDDDGEREADDRPHSPSDGDRGRRGATATAGDRDGSDEAGVGGAQQRSDARREQAPDPEDDGKPDTPKDLRKPTWKFALKRAGKEFVDDQCTDLAAALTYYAVLSMFPAVIALVSLLGVVGQADRTTDFVLGIVRDLAPGDVAETISGPLEELASSQAAGFGLVTGLAVALWSASNYVNAFSRAMNRIYEIGEGRPIWKLRPLMILVTLVALVLVAAVALSLVLSGPLAESVGSAVGLSSAAVTVWQWAKWPVMVLAVVVVIALLYWATPNIKQPKFRWVSPGAVVALVVWAVASALFAVYIANFGNYNATYGALAGVIVFLLWLWITNLALLFGAEFDSEMERGRELQAGLEAEDELQLPPRDTRNLEKKAEKEEKDREQARQIRLDAVEAEQHADAGRRRD